MSIKSALKKAGELFVEFPDQQPDFSAMTTPAVVPVKPAVAAPSPAQSPAVSVKEIVERTTGPNLDEITLTEEQTQDVLAPGGMPDFDKVYAKANLPKAGFGAEQAMEVIASLPADLPLNVKRTTVQATLSAMGKAMNQSANVNTESVVADASRKLAALSAYEDTLNLQAKRHIANMQAEIKTFEDKIANLNGQIASTQQMLTLALSQCTAEGDKLDDVLEFFTLDIGASKNTPPA
ncbi:MAG: hypothetical protein GC165_20855 [Armatimonadetes bacterium]|nr:hypothetical protein [Armatimonadota bacterium]